MHYEVIQKVRGTVWVERPDELSGVWHEVLHMAPTLDHVSNSCTHVLLVPRAFRFVGLSFLVPGVVSPPLPSDFTVPASYGDLIAAILELRREFSSGRLTYERCTHSSDAFPKPCEFWREFVPRRQLVHVQCF
jgi:hypothetical protein